MIEKPHLSKQIPTWVRKAAYHLSALPGVGPKTRAALSERKIDTIPQLKTELEQGGPYPAIPKFAGLTKLKAYNGILWLSGEGPVEEIPISDTELVLVREWSELLCEKSKAGAARMATKKLVELGIHKRPRAALSRIAAHLTRLGHTGDVTWREIAQACVAICDAHKVTTIHPPPEDETVQWWKDQLVESLEPEDQSDRDRLDAAVSKAAGLLKGELNLESACDHLLKNLKDIADELTTEQLAQVCALSVKEARREKQEVAA